MSFEDNYVSLSLEAILNLTAQLQYPHLGATVKVLSRDGHFVARLVLANTHGLKLFELGNRALHEKGFGERLSSSNSSHYLYESWDEASRTLVLRFNRLVLKKEEA